jgi:nucleotide-binding universal stress UspA family protein
MHRQINRRAKMIMNRILVPIDFSRDSLQAYALAAELFGNLGKTLILVHVIENISTDIENVAKAAIRFIDERERKLKAIAESTPTGWDAVEIVIVSGKSTEQIVRIAAEKTADIVVMGAHGNSGLVEELFGSTTYSVARRVRCSVLISK